MRWKTLQRDGHCFFAAESLEPNLAGITPVDMLISFSCVSLSKCANRVCSSLCAVSRVRVTKQQGWQQTLEHILSADPIVTNRSVR